MGGAPRPSIYLPADFTPFIPHPFPLRSGSPSGSVPTSLSFSLEAHPSVAQTLAIFNFFRANLELSLDSNRHPMIGRMVSGSRVAPALLGCSARAIGRRGAASFEPFRQLLHHQDGTTHGLALHRRPLGRLLVLPHRWWLTPAPSTV